MLDPVHIESIRIHNPARKNTCLQVSVNNFKYRKQGFIFLRHDEFTVFGEKIREDQKKVELICPKKDTH
jgi:hypothetical protein